MSASLLPFPRAPSSPPHKQNQSHNIYQHRRRETPMSSSDERDVSCCEQQDSEEDENRSSSEEAVESDDDDSSVRLACLPRETLPAEAPCPGLLSSRASSQVTTRLSTLLRPQSMNSYGSEGTNSSDYAHISVRRERSMLRSLVAATQPYSFWLNLSSRRLRARPVLIGCGPRRARGTQTHAEAADTCTAHNSCPSSFPLSTVTLPAQDNESEHGSVELDQDEWVRDRMLDA